MKKLGIITLLSALAFAQALPQFFGKCTAVNESIIDAQFSEIKKYDCQNDIIYIGIKNEIPGILKINVNKETDDFLIKHCKIQNHDAAAYVDKKTKKGVIAVKLNNGKSLILMFNGTDFLKYVTYLHDLNLNEIEN